MYELRRSKSKGWLHFLPHISNTIHDSSIWCYEGRRIETSIGFKICTEGRHKLSILFRKKISFTSRSNTASHSFCFSHWRNYFYAARKPSLNKPGFWGPPATSLHSRWDFDARKTSTLDSKWNLVQANKTYARFADLLTSLPDEY